MGTHTIRAAQRLSWMLLVVAAACGSRGNAANTKPERDGGADAGDDGGEGGNGGRGSTGSPDGGGGNGGSDGSGGTGSGDRCANVANPCQTAGVTCNADQLETCASNDDGCLVVTTTNCARVAGGFCEANVRPPRPQHCAVDPCAAVANPCPTAGIACNGTSLVECAMNADGCLVQTTTDCTKDGDSNTCGGTDPHCRFDKCKDGSGVEKADQCVSDATICADDVLETCVEDEDGCAIVKRTDCAIEADHNFCDDSATTPACSYDPCIEKANCLVAGKTCDGVKIVDCAADADNCLVKTVTNCLELQAGNTCDEATHTCVACQDAAGCLRSDGKVDGDSTCDGNILSTCTDSDGDGCLNKVTEDCGANFTCTADQDRCVSNGDNCASSVQVELAPGSSYGPYLTEGGGSEYSNYSCPQLYYAFQAAGADLLFAVDVAPQTVVLVSLTDVTGFAGAGSTGGWMQLLTRCADGSTQAEASCTDISDKTVRYANEGDTPVRVYVTVDADGASTVGGFGLEVDSRPLLCGDAILDGSEACDDGNIRSGDGCTPACKVESKFACTKASPSICTRRPSDGVCGNVQCDALPTGSNGATRCCTKQQECGTAYALYFGAGCFARNQQGAADSECPSVSSPSAALGIPMLPGCCRPDHKCGFTLGVGVGCTERTEVWRNMQDGYGAFLYPGPFDAIDCTP